MSKERTILAGAEPPAPAGQAVLPSSPVGPLTLVWSAKGLIRLSFGDELAAGIPVMPLSDSIRQNLVGYFDMKASSLDDIPVELSGTPFQLRVWGALRRIPFGAVRSYAGLARDLGSPRAMRAVGMAAARNPVAIVVPCHRVIAAGRQLGGFSGGLDRKRTLLRLEGVRVDGDEVSAGQLGLLD